MHIQYILIWLIIRLLLQNFSKRHNNVLNFSVLVLSSAFLHIAKSFYVLLCWKVLNAKIFLIEFQICVYNKLYICTIIYFFLFMVNSKLQLVFTNENNKFDKDMCSYNNVTIAIT